MTELNYKNIFLNFGILVDLLLVLHFINTTTLHASAQVVPSESLTTNCKATIFDVEQKLENYRAAYVSGVSIYEITTDKNLQTNQPLNLLMGLGANDSKFVGDMVSESSALNLLSSPQMLRDYSEKIINNCQDIVSVQFLLTEYQFRKFGLIDGSVKAFRCADSNSRSLPWGYQWCPH
jgi:hypothetical protein